jgi:predicted phage terminase large subunit-like protein
MMGAQCLWPERESLYYLMRRRAEIGHGAFEAEYQANPLDPANSEWPEEYFNWPGILFDAWPAKLDIRVVAIDPSKGRDAKHGDYSAIVSYGRAPTEVEYLEADLARRPVDKICTDAARICAAFKPDLLVLETNGFQELMKVPLLEALKKERVEVYVKGMDNSTNKHVRIRRLGVPLQRKKLRFKSRSPGTYLMLDQLKQFPQAAHDDGCDAAEMCRRAAIEWMNGDRPARR